MILSRKDNLVAEVVVEAKDLLSQDKMKLMKKNL